MLLDLSLFKSFMVHYLKKAHFILKIFAYTHLNLSIFYILSILKKQAMYKAFIKEWLLSNQSRVYSVITKTYGAQLMELKPTLFRKWLAKELDITEEAINLSSLNSALARYRKTLAEENKRGKNSTVLSSKNTPLSNESKDGNFTFSVVDSVTNKSRTKEL